MSIKDNYNKRLCLTHENRLEDKIDELTVMMGKLATRDNGMNRQFKSQITKAKEGAE